MPTIDLYLEQRLCARVRLDEASALLIGRGDDCDIQLPDRRVSRRHVRIGLDAEGGAWVEDLSAHGTRLNAEPLAGRVPLRSGDRIYLGDYALVFEPLEVPGRPFVDLATVMPRPRTPGAAEQLSS